MKRISTAIPASLTGLDGGKYTLMYWKVARTNSGFLLEPMYVDMSAITVEETETHIHKKLPPGVVLRNLVRGRAFINVVDLPQSLHSNYTILLAAQSGVTIMDVGVRISSDVFYVMEQDDVPVKAINELESKAYRLVPKQEIKDACDGNPPGSAFRLDDKELFALLHAEEEITPQPTLREAMARDRELLGWVWWGYMGTAVLATVAVGYALTRWLM